MINDSITSVRVQSANDPYIAGDNYRLTRSLWYAYNRPDAGGHAALEADGIPDVYRRVYEAITEGGHKGLARLIIDDDNEALDLFAYVVNLPAPKLVSPARLPATPPDELAANFFDDASERVARAIDESGPGSGTWPGTPSHTCAAKKATGTAIILRPDELTAARMFSPTWHTCPACYHKRVKRIAQQVLATGAASGGLTYAMLEAGDFRRWVANIRQHRKRTIESIAADAQAQIEAMPIGTNWADIERIWAAAKQAQAKAGASYRAHPQDDGTYFVMSTHGLAGAAVPTDKTELYNLLTPYVKTPEGKRASASHGFGGDYKRLKGDGRGAGIRLWTDAQLEQVAAAVGGKVKPGRNSMRVKIDQLEAFQRLADAGIAMRACKGDGPAVQQLTDVTNKGYGDSGKEYTLCVTHPPPAGTLPPIAPPRPPALYDDPADQEVQSWPS